ncbi:MAG: inorganic phosphate transporter [Spirochaetales bacterium]|nr:inorganic phosphate transporter [Spirochaetales bacterium]
MSLIIIFLSSGLFLGWSLGANDAANIFGTAVGTKMLRFTTAAIVGSIFVIIGAVISGAGASHTLGKLGAVDAIAGSFTVAFAAAFTVFWMTKMKLPVSTSQAVVGSIIGWNMFAGRATDASALTKIVTTWVVCPVLAAVFSFSLFFLVKYLLKFSKISIIRQDSYTRVALLLVGAFGAYSLGANNIANVMGVFIPVSPFQDVTIAGVFSLSGVQLLFLLGGVAIAVGIFTYSKRVMMTVGNSIFKLSPVGAFIVVLASSLVLFLFASAELQVWLSSHNLPGWPLVPVSSSQAVVGAVLGIGFAKSKGKNVDYRVIGRIGMGWIATPIASGALSFIFLFIMQNLFMQPVFS